MRTKVEALAAIQDLCDQDLPQRLIPLNLTLCQSNANDDYLRL